MNNNKENQRLDCEIVRDLLPLYYDGVVSGVTEATIKEHLDHCADCHKEYDELCADLPLRVSEPSTKNRFMDMMRRQRRKRLFITIMAVIVACALLVAAYFGQMQFPIANVPDDEITVHSVYRYETDSGYKVFVLYSIPYYDYVTGDVSIEKGENGDILVMNIKKPLITQKHTEMGTNDCVWLYECGSGDEDTFNAIEFGGNVVWNKDANGNDEIPAYVYAYEDFNGSADNVSTWFVSSKDGYLGAGYSDGGIIIWNFDGSVLYDSNADGK